ncbi:MAG: SH3 domain-containing protein, partial [Verrucomicrobiae bacterium]|nr:SH3 domain-containing protein [Verrucomicrobiae bacterium]
VRAGPGLNFSVVGALNKGDPIKAIRVLDDWIEIEAPPNSWAFINGLYLTREKGDEPETSSPRGEASSSPLPTAVDSQTKPSESTKLSMQKVSTDKARSPVAVRGEKPAVPIAGEPTKSTTPGAKPPPSESAVEVPRRVAHEAPSQTNQEPLLPAGSSQGGSSQIKRMVKREGTLIRSVIDQTPSRYRLRSIGTGRVIGYVRPSNAEILIDRYVGQRVIVEGIESWEPDSPKIPVIIADRITTVP